MFYLLYLIFFTVTLCREGFGQECGRCPDGFTYYPKIGKCYRVYDQRLVWSEAHEVCSKVNSHLVVVKEKAVLEPLNEVISQHKSSCFNDAVKSPTFWTSGRRNCPKGKFYWRTGLGTQWNLAYTNWLKGEPNNSEGNEECIHFLAKDANLEWNDTPCGSANCFVCEVDI